MKPKPWSLGAWHKLDNVRMRSWYNANTRIFVSTNIMPHVDARMLNAKLGAALNLFRLS